MTFPPSPVLARFSRRARAFLSRATPIHVERDRDVLSARLTALGRREWPAALDFQRDLAGLGWPSNVLGIELRPIEADPDDPLARALEESMVPIGSVEGDGDATAYINEAGEVFSSFGPRSSSIVTYIEQAAMWAECAAESHPRFAVFLRPALGEALAAALSLSGSFVPEASDVYERWWANGRLRLRHRAYDEICARQDVVTTASLADACHVLARAHGVSPGLFVHVGAAPTTYLQLSPGEAAEVPDERSWRGTRYSFGNESGAAHGSVWVVGEGEDMRVHEYIKHEGALHTWITIDSAGATSRHLPSPPWQREFQC